MLFLDYLTILLKTVIDFGVILFFVLKIVLKCK